MKLGLIPGRRGDAALAAPGGHRARGRAVRDRQSDFCQAGTRMGHRRRADRRRSAGRRGEIRPRSGRQAAAKNARHPRPLRRSGGDRDGHRRTQEAGRQNLARHAGALSGDRGGRSGRQAPVRRRRQERGGTLPRVPVLQRIEIADSRLLRRADGREDPRPAARHQAHRRQECGRDRRRHDGGRHHDDLRERRHSRRPQRGRSARPRPRAWRRSAGTTASRCSGAR